MKKRSGRSDTGSPEEPLFRSVLEQTSEGFVLLDARGRFLDVNEAFCRLSGFSREAITGHGVEAFVSEEARDAWQALVAGILSPAGGIFEAALVRQDGGLVPVMVHANPFRREERGPDPRTSGAAFALVTDMSERLRAEGALREREERLRLILDGINDGTWDWHIPSDTFHFNRRFTEMLGYLPEEIAPNLTALKGLVMPEDLPALLQGFQTVLDGRSGRLDMEFRMQNRFGEPVWILGRGRVTVRDKAGRPLRMSGSTINISRRKRAEEALAASEQRLRTILDSFPDVILQVDPHLRVLWANEAVRQRSVSLVGRTCHEIFCRRDEACDGCPCATALRSGGIERHVIHRPGVDGGEDVYWEVTGIPLKDGSGIVTGLVEVARNITERMRMEIRLREERDRAEEASRAKGAFLANMSHELRTPMNAIIGMTDLLLETQLSREQRELLSTVRASSGMLLEIISDLLDFARIEAGRFELSAEPFSVRELCGQVVWVLDVAALRKGLILEHREEGPIPELVVGDPLRLRQVLVNLIGNALKFTERGRIALSVRGAVAEDRRVRLTFSVKDTGIGIPSDKRELLFRPFSQVDSSSRKRFQGTGLGLVISRQIVEAMGGTMGFESVEGKGSTFFFSVTLPQGSREEPPSEFSGGDVLSRRVLVVEDDSMQALLLRRLLEKRGWVAEVASTGEDALALVREERYDAVLLEAHLPDGDAPEIAQRLRTLDDSGGHLPLVVLGRPPEGALDGGLEKPIDPEDLFRLLETLAEGRILL